MEKHKIMFSNQLNAMVDQAGRCYFMAENVEDAIETMDAVLKPKGLKVLVGKGQDNYFFTIVDADSDIGEPDGCYGVKHGHVKMRPFEDHDWEGFAGAGEHACMGTMKFSAEGNPMWKMFDGNVIVIADENGVGLYFNDDDCTCEAVMTYEPGDANVDASLRFIARELGALNTPSSLLAAGFRTDVYDIGNDCRVRY